MLTTLGLLPQPKFNYRALLTSFVLQSAMVVVLIRTGVIEPVKLVASARKVIYTPLVVAADTTPKFQPSVRGYVPPVVKLVVPKPVPVIPSPVLEPPKVEMQAKAPTLPPAPVSLPKPVVRVGAFLPSTEKPTLPKSTPAAQVQTGGFGDPNGIKGVGDGKSKLTAPSLGSFGMPSGPGYGNGTGGAHGKAGVGVAVQSSGFSDESVAAAPTRKVAAAPERETGKGTVTIISKPRPLYTEEARQLHLEGEVLLRVKFLTTGEVQVLTVVRGLGHGLDEQAMYAAKKIQFKPAEYEGRLVDSEATVHIIFELAS
jgi:TonB family protein